MGDLIDWLTERQRAAGLTDAAFAARLAMPSQSNWTVHRTRRRGVTKLLVDRALEAFPELRGEILRAAFPPLREGDRDPTSAAVA